VQKKERDGELDRRSRLGLFLFLAMRILHVLLDSLSLSFTRIDRHHLAAKGQFISKLFTSLSCEAL
jgi:flagellar biosynthesis protein FliR